MYFFVIRVLYIPEDFVLNQPTRPMVTLKFGRLIRLIWPPVSGETPSFDGFPSFRGDHNKAMTRPAGGLENFCVKIRNTLQGTNISHLGKGKVILKKCLGKRIC